MRNLLKTNDTKKYRNRIVLQGSLGMLVILALLLAACGGATTGNSAVETNAPAQHSASSSSQGSTSSSGQTTKSSLSVGPQYLIKSLQVNMLVKDTRQVASDLQSWIATADPRSTSAGINYEQTYDNFYNVTMTFSVTSAQYTQIEEYLAGYAQQHGGKLTGLHESVQDVSNDYIDTQSRLTNLRGEQQRLLTLLSHASALGDVLSIDQRLTDVEGQIEQIEAHLNSLNGQITFYNISISLQPSQAALTPSTGWSVSSIWQNALSAAIAFAQVLATVFIWLVVFSVYIIPLALIVWFVRRWRRAQEQRAAPAVAATTQPPPS